MSAHDPFPMSLVSSLKEGVVGGGGLVPDPFPGRIRRGKESVLFVFHPENVVELSLLGNVVGSSGGERSSLKWAKTKDIY